MGGGGKRRNRRLYESAAVHHHKKLEGIISARNSELVSCKQKINALTMEIVKARRQLAVAITALLEIASPGVSYAEKRDNSITGGSHSDRRRIARKAIDDMGNLDDGSVCRCYDCFRLYGHEHGFPDLIIPYWAWKEISPSGDDGGLLCPSCICKRLHDKGITCEGAFMSGSVRSIDRDTMAALRRVENIELAIEGRDNRWSGIRDMVTGGEG